MRKRSLSFLLLAISTITMVAQTNQCGTDQMHQKLYFGFPGIHNKVIQNNQELESFTQQYIANAHSQKKGSPIYVIPVVFHVIHNYGVENISNQQIMDQLRIINEDYQKRNADTIDIIPAFQPIAADCQIEFRLAQLDPNGNCTSGITRHQDTRTYIGDHSVKDIVHWDPSKYLNIYICSAAAGLAGHAIVPSAADTIPQWDGIVIAHSSVGSIGTSSPTTSVVLTHEIGHYLNLQHVWGGNNVPGYPYLPVADTGNCAYDDGVSDTPNTIGWQTCNLNGQSCGSLDNIQNFMEYAYCPAMFTEGQKLRMHAALNSPIANRNNLWTPANLAATGTDSVNYFCSVNFTEDKTKICTGNFIQFNDISYHGVDTRNWEFEGGTPSTSTDTYPLIQYNTPGKYQVKLVCSSNGISDSVTKTEWIEVFEDTARTINLLEGFEGVSDLNNDKWFVNNPDSSYTWEIDSTVGYNSNRCAKMNNYNNGIENVDELISKPIDISNVSGVTLTFDYAFAKKTNNDQDKLRVSISSDCGETWFVRKQLANTTFTTTADTVITEFVPASNTEWKSATVNSITSTYWTADFMVKFTFTSNGGNHAYIDNIMLYDPATTNLEESPVIQSDLYPNPSNGLLNITLNQTIDNPTFIVTDLSGKTVWRKTIVNSITSYQLDLSSLANGIYLVNMESKQGYSNSSKIIIHK